MTIIVLSILCHNIDIVMNACSMQNYMNRLQISVGDLLFAMLMQTCALLLPSALKWTCTCLRRLDRSQSASILPRPLWFQTKQQPDTKTSPVETLRASRTAALVVSRYEQRLFEGNKWVPEGRYRWSGAVTPNIRRLDSFQNWRSCSLHQSWEKKI